MYNRSQVKLRAKQSLSGRWGTAIGTLIVSGIILSLSATIPFATMILTGVISVGMSIVFLEIVRGWNLAFEDMFKGFNNFGTNCIAGILTAIYTFLWTLLFIVPGIVKSFSYAMTPYVLADHPEYTASQAIDESRRIMDGRKADLFVLYLSFIGWDILSMFTFGILMLYVLPYKKASVAAFYDAVKDEKNVGASYNSESGAF